MSRLRRYAATVADTIEDTSRSVKIMRPLVDQFVNRNAYVAVD